MTSLVQYGQRGRKIIFAHALYNASQEWSDSKLTWGDLTAGGYLLTAGIALVIPDPVITAIGYTSTRVMKAAITRAAIVGASASRFARAFQSLPAFARGGVGSQLLWAGGVTHLLTLPWQIKELQEKKEREGQVDTMALVPGEPGQSPMMNPAAWSPQGRVV